MQLSGIRPSAAVDDKGVYYEMDPVTWLLLYKPKGQ